MRAGVAEPLPPGAGPPQRAELDRIATQQPLCGDDEQDAEVGADDGLDAPVTAALCQQAEAGAQHQARRDGVGVGDPAVGDVADEGERQRPQPGGQGGNQPVDEDHQHRVHGVPPPNSTTTPMATLVTTAMPVVPARP